MGRFENTRKRCTARIQILLAAVCALVLLTAAPAAGQQHPILVSVNAAGTGSGNARSGDFNRYRITPDGRYVLFFSQATDLLPNSGFDIFVRDLLTATTTLVSVGVNGSDAIGISSFGLISDNGRYVAFTSHAHNLVDIPTPNGPAVYVRDMQTSTTKLVSINAAGTAGSFGISELIDMSPDGRFITFSGTSTDLIGIADGNDVGNDIYVRDMQTNVTKLVSVNAAGTASGNGTCFAAGSVSADGRYVAFQSAASNLVANDSGIIIDVFLRDVQAGTTIRLSTNNAGTAGGNEYSVDPIIDRAGRFIVFASLASDLTPLPDSNVIEDIFIFDLQTGTKRLITVNSSGTAAGSGLPFGVFRLGVQYKISADSRYVAFYSQSGNLVPNDTNNSGDDVFRYEVASQTKILVSVNMAGTSGTLGGSREPAISADGRFVAFNSLANDLVNVADETSGGTSDVFVRDIVAGQTYLASLNSAGNRTGNGFSFQPVISADGKRIAFHSRASDLITNDLNGFNEDIFAFDIASSGPVILQELFSERAIALESVTQTRDPFFLLAPLPFSDDHRTRLSLFVWRLGLQPGEGASVLSAQAEDDQGGVHPVVVEYAGPTPGLTDVTQVIIKLPETVTVPANLWLKITLRGTTSNRALVRIIAP